MQALSQNVTELHRRHQEAVFDEVTINLALSLVKEHPDKIEQARAAVILSGIVKNGLGGRVREFLAENKRLDTRVRQILEANILRMEGY